MIKQNWSSAIILQRLETVEGKGVLKMINVGSGRNEKDREEHDD